MESYRKLPNECVYGVVEVKTKLDKPSLIEACEKIELLKAYPKTAFNPNDKRYQSRSAYGKTYPYCPTSGMIFAFDSTNLLTLGRHLLDWCATHEPDKWPDSVWVLGKGYLVWTSPINGLVDPSPQPGSGLLALRPSNGEDILFPFVIHMDQLFATAWMPPLRLVDYAGGDSMGMVAGVLKQPTRDPNG